MFSLFKKLILLLCLPIFGIAISIGLVEIGFRILSSFSKPPRQWTDRPAAYFNPAQSKTLQGNVYPEEKPTGGFRVAVLGDSFTFAPYMQPDDAFPARLERLFQMSGSEQIEVINYGVPGFSTNHESKEARRAIKEGADLLVLQITLNDPQVKSYQPTGLTGVNEFGPYAPKGFTKELTQYWTSLRFFLERFHNTNTHQRYVDYYHKLFQDERSWGGFTRAITKLAKLSKQKEIPLVATIFPLFGVPLNENYPFHALHAQVEAELSKRDIPTLDLYKTFEGIPLARLQVIPGGDFHPNEIGHRMASEAIYHWLKEDLAVIPQEFLSAPQFAQRTDIRLLDSNRKGSELKTIN